VYEFLKTIVLIPIRFKSFNPKAIVRTFPKLRGSEGEFEYGFNLKVYPDDPIEVAVKGGKKSSGFSIGNWISTLLSPVDASEVKSE
jgi:hypothetical protein